MADAQNPRKVGRATRSSRAAAVSIRDSQGNSFDRRFDSVAISATANALMVVENWYVSASSQGGPVGPSGGGCGSYNSNQLASVSLIDISDPERRDPAARQLRDRGQPERPVQDDLRRRRGDRDRHLLRHLRPPGLGVVRLPGRAPTPPTPSSPGTSASGASPRRLDALDFGKPNELVRASAYDADRKVVYAITAQRIDPLYAISFADRAEPAGALRDRRAVGRDERVPPGGGQEVPAGGRARTTARPAPGSRTPSGWQPTKIAVSLIDVQDLAGIRLVQRQCVAVKNAEWIGSDITNNLDQAHKMLGMHSDGDLNVITVPVHYTKRIELARRLVVVPVADGGGADDLGPRQVRRQPGPPPSRTSSPTTAPSCTRTAR